MYITTSWSSSAECRYKYIHFLMTNILEQQLLCCSTWSSNQLLNLNISLLFLQTFLLINAMSLCFDPWIFCHPLANLFPSFWLFFVLFWMLWMLVTMHKLCHVPQASRVTTWVKTLLKDFLVCPKNESDLGHTFSW